MIGRYLMFLAAAFVLGVSAFAAQDEFSQVSLKGVLQQDKGGIFVKAAGGIYDLKFVGPNQKALTDTAQGLLGSTVLINGNLQVQDLNTDHAKLMVFADNLSRIQPEATGYVPPPPPPAQPPVIIEERERPGIHLPGVHINW